MPPGQGWLVISTKKSQEKKSLKIPHLILKMQFTPFNPLRTGNSQMGSMANNEDPDEMLHKVVFHHGLHYCKFRNFRENLFSLVALKDIFATFKNRNFGMICLHQ